MADVGCKRSLDGDSHSNPARKKLKLSDLPISQSKRSAIDNLLHTFRKKGEYDTMRKLLFAQFEADVSAMPAKAALLASLEELVDRETDRTPSLLSKDPRVAVSLIEGAGERSDIYKNVVDTLNALMNKLFDAQGIQKMREFRVAEIGAKAAAEEAERGRKTDQDYAQEAEARRQGRVALREKELEEEREKEREEKVRREERKRREREEDEARDKARQEREERKRKEREDREKEEEEARIKEREREEKEREERRERRKREEEARDAEREARLKRLRDENLERERAWDEQRNHLRDRRRDSRARSRSPNRNMDRGRRKTKTPEPIKPIKVEDIKVDDDLALQALLQESEQMKKSRQRPALERSESLEPPMRKALAPKSLVPRDPLAARLGKLDTKSRSPTKIDIKISTPPAAAASSATATKKEDVAMEDASPEKEPGAPQPRSRWDQPPPSKGEDKARARSRSRSVSIRKRSRSRSHSRGSRYDRRSTRFEDDHKSRREHDRWYASHDDSRRQEKDDRGGGRSRRREGKSARHSRSPSQEAYPSRRKSRYDSRSPSPRRDKDRSPSQSPARSRSRDKANRSHTQQRHRSRSRSPEGIDRYVPGGTRKLEEPKEKSYRSREYDRWEAPRDRDRDRDRNRDRPRDRDRDRNRERGSRRDRRRRERSRTRSRSRSRPRR
ncbi:hypothetical protein BDV95DRAFT_627518 [Massariosphaeria phaeospora]|uniref:BOD1/SHG1 domain-containing protein n=1 Tax=Massariosphaeria phaeospora TaxID=100035 RepID=A0A7C8MCP3_9PLEO|nr:hypothetical protein BDV95DRAFT_627518 [Massariosphaeria phaeospora]